jgi:DNA polymerase-3 subunit epsilon
MKKAARSTAANSQALPFGGQPLAFVDLETSGATAHHDRITEVGIVTVDPDGHVEEWSSLVNPGQRIPPFIESLTGISNATAF